MKTEALRRQRETSAKVGIASKKSPNSISRGNSGARATAYKLAGFCASLFLALGLALVHTGCRQRADAPANALAKVGDEVITEASYRSWWEQRMPSTDNLEERRALLGRLIERSALAQAAREVGLDQDPALIEQVENLLIGRLKETQLEPELKSLQIPETDLKADYEANLNAKFFVPERVRVGVLWFNTRGQAPLSARYRPRLEEARQSAANLPVQAGFGSLAIQNSEHRASRYKGGDLGWLEVNPANDQWKEQILAIASQLQQPGEISRVVATDQGLFLVRLIERQAAHVIPYESVREGIERRLLSQRRKQMEDQFNEQILARMSVQRFPERLRALRDLPIRENASGVSSPLQLGAN